MLPYLVLAGAVACLWLLLKREQISRFLFVGTAFLFMFFFLAFRAASVGEDTQMYLDVACVARDMPWTNLSNIAADIIWQYDDFGYGSSIDVGYLILNKIIMLGFNCPQAVVIFCSAVICAGFARFIYRNERDVAQATWIFLCGGLYMFAFNGMRQMLAMAIAIQFYECARKGRWIQATLWILGGWFFHTSAIIFLVFLVLFRLVKNEKIYRGICILCCAIPIMLPFAEPLVALVSEQYAKYFSNNIWEISVNGVMLIWLLLLASLIVTFVRGKKSNELHFLTLVALSYLALMLASLSLSVFERLSLYSQAFLPLFFAQAKLTLERWLTRGSTGNGLGKHGKQLAGNAIAHTVPLLYSAGLNVLMFMLYLSYAGTDVRQWFACF